MAPAERTMETDLNRQLALVIACERTVKVMILLSDGVTSPKEVGERLEISTTNASHHLKKLKELGLAELIEERDVGGSVQHIYRATIRPIVGDEDWSTLSLAQRQRYSIWIVQLILADAAKSFDAELFDIYIERHLSRTPLVVDKEGIGEIAEIQNKALEDTIQVQATSRERMLKTDEEGINLIAAMMCFPLPGPSDGPMLRKDFR